MLKGLFVTGTDTGVGKTEVGTQIAAKLWQHGIAVTARKPVESGCARTSNGLSPADASRYQQALDNSLSLEKICPYRFEAALAPPVAARQQGVNLTLSMLIQACSNTEEALNIVEGAGGFYSPLATHSLNADLAAALGYPVIVVAANRLGCINHVLLTLAAIAHRGLETLAIIVNETDPRQSINSNGPLLRELQPLPVIDLGYNDQLDIHQLFSLFGHPLKSLYHRVG